MDIKHTLSITEARKRIFEITNDVQAPGIFYTLTENGRPKAVIMSAEEFESWAETLDVYETFPDLAKDIEETKEAVKTGAYKHWITLEHLLMQQGFVVADKSKKKYGVQDKHQTKRGKKSKKNS